MRVELRQYSSIGNKAGILLFCKEVITGEKEDYSSVKAVCSFKNGIDLNFNCAVLLFSDLGVLKWNEEILMSNNIIPYNEDHSFINDLCSLCFSKLLEENLFDVDKVKFNEVTLEFYASRSAFKLEAAIFRNMLIELDAMRMNESNEFVFKNEFENIFFKHIKHHRLKITQNELLQTLDEKQRIGAEGEMFVLKFEKERLAEHPKHQNIRIISDIDVTAGYDIISYKSPLSNKLDRFIEVKTFIGSPHFYWSINEIKQARLRREQYFIYLLDYSKIDLPDYIPEMISDPYASIYNSKNEWMINATSYQVTKMNK